jgi:recombination protein RecA
MDMAKKASSKKEAADPMKAVLANIEKRMGKSKSAKEAKSPFARFNDIEKVDVDVIPFGIKDIDDASYADGIPRGKMVEIFGGESSGKSLLTLHLIASAQKQGLDCALVDIEQSFDPAWAEMHGVDVGKLIYANTFDGAGEEALEYTYQLCKSGAFGLVVVDSTAALTPMSEIEGSLENNARVGAQAQMMSRGCRKICAACGASQTTCVFINQIRMKIGVTWGNPETTPGGKALPFYSHIRIKVRKTGTIKAKEDGVDKVVGQTSAVQFIKNKIARPFGQAEFKVVFDPKALNPVVMLCNALREAKMISIRNSIFSIAKDTALDYFDEKKSISTGTTNLADLADWLIEHDLVVRMLDILLEEMEEDEMLNINIGELDEVVIELKEDPTKIVSPTGKVIIETKKLGDISEEEQAKIEAEDADIEDFGAKQPEVSDSDLED